MWHKPGSSLNTQVQTLYEFDYLRWIAIEQILQHVQEDGTLGLGDLSHIIYQPEVGFEYPDRMVTTKQKYRDVIQRMCDFSPCNAQYQVFTTELDWNPSALRHALRMGLADNMKYSLQYRDILNELSALFTPYQRWNTPIWQQRPMHATQRVGAGTRFTSSSRPQFLRNTHGSHCWNRCWITQGCVYGPRRGQTNNWDGRQNKVFCRREMFIVY